MIKVKAGQETDLEHLKFVLRLKLAMGAMDSEVMNLKKSILVCEGMGTEMDAMEYMQEINSVTLPKERKEKIEGIREKIIECLKKGLVDMARDSMDELRHERVLMQSAIRDMKSSQPKVGTREVDYSSPPKATFIWSKLQTP